MSNIHLVNYKPHIHSKTLFPTTKTVPRNKHNWVKFLVWFYNLNCILDLKKYHFSLIICKELKHVWYYVNPEFLWFLSVFLKSMTRSQAISLNNLRVPLIAHELHIQYEGRIYKKFNLPQLITCILYSMCSESCGFISDQEITNWAMRRLTTPTSGQTKPTLYYNCTCPT